MDVEDEAEVEKMIVVVYGDVEMADVSTHVVS